MTRSRTEKILARLAEIDHEKAEILRVRSEIAISGMSSASLSSGGGSKSYTRTDLDKLSALLRELNREMQSLRSQLACGFGFSRIMTVRG